MEQNIRFGTFGLNALKVMSDLKESVKPNTELVIVFFEDGRFAYYSSNKKEIVRLARILGWLLDETHIDSSGILTGGGYYPPEWFNICFWQCKTEKKSIEIETILKNTWQSLVCEDYYPRSRSFQYFEKANRDCFYLYDYYRTKTKHEMTDLDKRVRNLIFRMKSGSASHEAAFLLAKAIDTYLGIGQKKENLLIVPIPASNPESL